MESGADAGGGESWVVKGSPIDVESLLGDIDLSYTAQPGVLSVAC